MQKKCFVAQTYVYINVTTVMLLSSLAYSLQFHCRTSPAEFIIPFDQYMESVKNNYSIGMRFKMRFEGEEAPEQRYGYCMLMLLKLVYFISLNRNSQGLVFSIVSFVVWLYI